MPALVPRDDYYDCYTRFDGSTYCRTHNAWNDWVRWVVLAVVIIGFLLLFFAISCISARRRRKLGRQPFYGTGWAARPMGGQNAQPYYNPNYNQPAPPYTAQPQNTYSGANQGYYGQQQQGVELQSPPPTHHRGGDENVYEPPAGPPPGKH